MQSGGLKYDANSPDIHIVNTCAVTAEATKEAIRAIRRIKKNNPHSTVVVTGCSAQVDTDKFSDLKDADLVIANSHKGEISELIHRHLKGELKERIFKSNIFKKEDLGAGGGIEVSHTRSFLKIQDGCNSFCTYCVIPFARGKSRSIPIDELVKKINDLYCDGVREVVLTGVHIGDYRDETFKLNKQGVIEDLIEQVLIHSKMPRIRLTSFEPVEITHRLLELYKDPRLCPHFHMSIQSAHTRVLQDMKRNYTAKDVEWSLNIIQKQVPNAFVGMDVIVGFPGETEDDFLETYKRLESLPWARIHVFPYSERPNTFAARLSNKWPRSLIMDRAKTLRGLSSVRFAQEALKQVGLVKEALVIGSKNSEYTQCLSTDYWNISIPLNSEPLTPGQLIQVKIEGYEHLSDSRMDGLLTGRLQQFISY